jgi:predicted glycoside hydrolase/deacetylase ChbG (UPF0249 family)
MAREPGIPLNQAELRYRYTAAQALAEGATTAQAGKHLRDTYGLEDQQLILQYVREGQQSLTLAQAYLSGDQTAINAAKAEMAPGMGGEYVLTVKVRLQDGPPQTPGGVPTEEWRTVRIVVQPGMTAADVAASLAAQYEKIKGEYDASIMDYLGLSALAV